MNVNIEEVLHLEAELKGQGEIALSASLAAKVNMLKYLQVQAVMEYQAEYDGLYYELKKEGGLECIRNIAPFRSGDLLQPKVLETRDCVEDDRLDEGLEFYLADAELAKQGLDELITTVTSDLRQCEVQCVSVKSRESTRRKAIKFCGGNVRKITDMARVTVTCDTPKALEQAYLAIIASLPVSRNTKIDRRAANLEVVLYKFAFTLPFTRAWSNFWTAKGVMGLRHLVSKLWRSCQTTIKTYCS